MGVWGVNMRKWIHIEGRLESITISDPTAKMGDTNENRQMTLKDYMYPTRSTQFSYITLPVFMANFEIKSGMTHILLVFQGLTKENPYQHIRDLKIFVEP